MALSVWRKLVPPPSPPPSKWNKTPIQYIVTFLKDKVRWLGNCYKSIIFGSDLDYQLETDLSLDFNLNHNRGLYPSDRDL